MAMTIFSRAGLVLTLLMALSGCQHASPSFDAPLACPSPPVVLEKVLLRDRLKGTMKALVDMEVESMGRRYPVRMAVMARGDDALRMEAIPLIGLPDFMLSVKGNRLHVFLPAKGEFYIGEASEHLRRFVPIPVKVGDVVSILMGAYPPLKDGDCLAPGAVEGDIRQIHVLKRDGNVRMSLWMKWPEQVLVRLKTFGGREEGDYTVTFSDHTMVGQIIMPGKLIMTGGGITGLMQTITVHYSDVEFTDEGDAPFELAVPAGVIPIDMKAIPDSG
jgi:hypothetical protein